MIHLGMSKSSATYFSLVLFLCSLLEIHYASADQYIVPPADLDIVGTLQTARIKDAETLVALIRRVGFGQEEVRIANPSLDRWVPIPGERVVLPSRYVLPDAPQSGIVINLPEMRLYYFYDDISKQATMVETFPVSIGRSHWSSPVGHSYVTNKKENPDWYPPESIKSEAALRGQPLPDKVPAGSSNPLGKHAIYLSLPGYLLHGTNAPNGIGMRVTHGCFRLYPEDIEKLFHKVEIGTQVALINQPVKVGWHANDLYLEVHPPVVEPVMSNDELLELAVTLIKKENSISNYKWRTSQVKSIVTRQTGIPELIHRIPRNKSLPE